MSMVAQVILKPRKARPFHGRHPWVLDSAIERVEGNPADGDVVDLVSDKMQWIARGTFNARSRIRVRLYTWRANEDLDDDFWRGRLESAVDWRGRLLPDQADGGVRLVYSEADGLSGLIVDRYAGYLVLQVTSLGIASRLESVVRILGDLVRPVGISLRGERNVVRWEGLEIAEETLWGQAPDGPVFISEHGLRYGVDIRAGHKTGFYLDQRDNRRAAAGYFGSRRVLDLFCYSGAFGLCAASLGSASEVLGIDSSAKAIALAKANAALNGMANVRFEVGDVFQTLDALAASNHRFGGIVLDPPKFAQTRQSAAEALRAYHQLNRTAVSLLEPDGVLVTCSCSGHVGREDFLHMLSEVAQRSGRNIQILEQRGAAPDHPTSASCLETEYLKCFICRVF